MEPFFFFSFLKISDVYIILFNLSDPSWIISTFLDQQVAARAVTIINRAVDNMQTALTTTTINSAPIP